jgi:hypothetical protein
MGDGYHLAMTETAAATHIFDGWVRSPRSLGVTAASLPACQRSPGGASRRREGFSGDKVE